MAVLLSPVGGVAAQFFDNNGNPLTGGKLYSYSAGTTTPAATYTSSLGTTAHPNPIVLDAGGRVPGGEIWLTDGVIYKFVLQTSTNVLIATYDNIVGINSNFVNYTASQEIQTATAGQTVFNLATTQYQPGTNSLSVFVDGVNQYGLGAQYAYLETDSDTVTFVTGLHVGASVKFTTTTQTTGNATDASVVAYDPPFANSVVTDVEAKLAQTVSVKDFGAVGDGIADDTAAVQDALDSGAKAILFPYGTYKLTSSITIPQQVSVQFDTATIKGHFADFLIKMNFYGETVLSGKLVLTDDDASVVSAATTLTKGIEFGSTGSAIHGVDTSGCDIYASQLLVAYYFGEYSYSNTYGVLRAFNCGNVSTDSVLMYAVGGGLIAANDTYVQKLEITGSNTATWNGAGLNVSGGFGVTFGQLHIESIYNANGAQFNNCCVNVLGGYFESVGAATTSNTLYVNAGSTVTIQGALINCPVDLDVRTLFIGCRFFKQEMYARATYIECTWPETRNLAIDVTNLEVSDFPIFGATSTEQLFRNFSGNWTEFGVGYTGMAPDFDYFGGDHQETFILDAWSNGIALSCFKNAPGSGYFGAIGFRFPDYCANAKVFAWAIVRIPSTAGVSQVRLGVGGVLDTGSSNTNSISTLTAAAGTDKWWLFAMPNATVFTSSTYGNAAYFFFEPSTEDQNDAFHVDSFGIETGGLSYKSLGTSQSKQAKQLLSGNAAPTDGTWAVGDRMIRATPTVGQPKAWVCTVAGTPGTWVSEGNL